MIIDRQNKRLRVALARFPIVRRHLIRDFCTNQCTQPICGTSLIQFAVRPTCLAI